MQQKVTNFNMKNIKNRIILNNLSKRQKEILMKTGIIGGGLGSGLFMLYSMKTPQIVPVISQEESPVYDSKELPKTEPVNSIEIISVKPVTEISEQNISFAEAFKVAREICGTGGWFLWRGNIYNTYYKEEWQALSQDEKNDYLASIVIKNTQNNEYQDDTNDSEFDSNNLNIASSSEVRDENELEDNIEVNVFSVDLNTGNNQENVPDESITNDNNVIIDGEIINLDDDTELVENGYFEISDDIEISLISDSDSELIDNLNFDSSVINTFPWESSDTEGEIEPTTDDTENIPFEVGEDNEEGTVITDKPNDENLLGEPVIIANENEPEIEVLQEITDEATTKVITNPDEIREYLWSEVIVNQDTEINAQIIQEDAELIPKEENIGIIVAEETDLLRKLPSFNDVTELPWGETLPHTTVDSHTASANESDILTNQQHSLTEDEE